MIDPHIVVENERFPLEGGEEAYEKLRNISPNISVSKTLDPAHISYPVVDRSDPKNLKQEVG